MMKASVKQQLSFLARDALKIINEIVNGYVYDPGSSDLDDEQPIHVRATLGGYRHAFRLKCELEKLLNVEHEWTGVQQGGNPAEAGSYEWIRYCKICGIEDCCQDPMPPCFGGE